MCVCGGCVRVLIVCVATTTLVYFTRYNSISEN